MLAHLRYLLAFSLTGSVFIAMHSVSWASFAALAYAFGFVPLLEVILPPRTQNASPSEIEGRDRSVWFDVMLVLAVPAQFYALGLLLWVVPDDIARGDYVSLVGHITAYGVSSGALAINVAHELGHRPQKHFQTLAQLLLITTLYGQFFIDHNWGHHKHVATPEDPSSARKNESIYAFWLRSVWGVWRSAWRIDPARMGRLLLWESALFLAIAWIEPTALLPWVLASVIGFLLLETVNYIEHYGLERKKESDLRYETASPVHSWNSNHPLGRFLLFELTRHSDHHAAPHKKYPALLHHDASPQMPAGYPAMMVLTLCPPLWFKVMNHRIPKN
jgi:alkane 1-monooxygenase